MRFTSVQIFRRFCFSGSIFILMGTMGCATASGSNSPVRVALTEMGAVSNSEYSVHGLRMVRSINVTGLGAEEVVGSLTVDPDKWSATEQARRLSPLRTDLPDSMAPRLVAGQSVVVERRFDSSASASHLVQLRDQLQAYQAKIAETARLKIKIEILNIVANAKTVKKDGGVEVIDSKFTALLASLYPNEPLKKFEDLKKAIDETSLLLNSIKLEDQLKSIQDLLKIPGILVTKWQREDSMAVAATSAMADGGGGKNKTVGGLLILGSPRIITLYFGNDLIARAEEKQTKYLYVDSLFPSERNYITHYQLRAKHVLFVENQYSAYRANLEVHLDEIAKLLPQLNGVDSTVFVANLKANLATQYAAVMETSAFGVLDGEKSFVQTRHFSMKRSKINDFLSAEVSCANGTIPVINMRVALDGFLVSRLKGANEMDFKIPESDTLAEKVAQPCGKSE